MPPLHLPYARHCLEPCDHQAVLEVLQSDCLTRGARVREFEEQLAAKVGAEQVVCFSNASSALWAACQALGIDSRDQAWVPTNTFVATATCVMQRGAQLRLMEIDPHSGNLDLERLELETSSSQRRLFLPVHFAGRAVEMRQFSRQLNRWSDLVIEDAAHAIGSSYPCGGLVGSCCYSDMTVFSFHACKNISCAEGGAVSTNQPLLAKKLRQLRDSGIVRGDELGSPDPWYYEVQALSCNSHMNELQAALGLSQLRRLDQIGLKKQRLIEGYRRALNPKIKLIEAAEGVATHYHLAVVLIDFAQFGTTRKALMQQLRLHGIGSQVHYIPLYRHPLIANYPHWLREPTQQWLASEAYYNRALSLPLFATMQQSDLQQVVLQLHRALGLG